MYVFIILFGLEGGAVVIANVEQGRHRRGIDGFPHGTGVEDLGEFR